MYGRISNRVYGLLFQTGVNGTQLHVEDAEAGSGEGVGATGHHHQRKRHGPVSDRTPAGRHVRVALS